jgi:hypothetical protein
MTTDAIAATGRDSDPMSGSWTRTGACASPDPGGLALRRILCGVDDERRSQEAARQAVALASGGGVVDFVAVSGRPEPGTARIPLSQARAQLALADARAAAAHADVPRNCTSPAATPTRWSSPVPVAGADWRRSAASASASVPAPAAPCSSSATTLDPRGGQR